VVGNQKLLYENKRKEGESKLKIDLYIYTLSTRDNF